MADSVSCADIHSQRVTSACKQVDHMNYLCKWQEGLVTAYGIQSWTGVDVGTACTVETISPGACSGSDHETRHVQRWACLSPYNHLASAGVPGRVAVLPALLLLALPLLPVLPVLPVSTVLAVLPVLPVLPVVLVSKCTSVGEWGRQVQVVIAKHGLSGLLSTNYYFTDLLTGGGGLLDKEPEQKLVWLCGGILSNIALHPNNRSGLTPLGHHPLTCRLMHKT